MALPPYTPTPVGSVSDWQTGPAAPVGVKALRAFYSTPHFMDPIDILWGKSGVNGIAIYEWILDLETMAELATA